MASVLKEVAQKDLQGMDLTDEIVENVSSRLFILRAMMRTPVIYRASIKALDVSALLTSHTELGPATSSPQAETYVVAISVRIPEGKLLPNTSVPSGRAEGR